MSLPTPGGGDAQVKFKRLLEDQTIRIKRSSNLVCGLPKSLILVEQVEVDRVLLFQASPDPEFSNIIVRKYYIVLALAVFYRHGRECQ